MNEGELSSTTVHCTTLPLLPLALVSDVLIFGLLQSDPTAINKLKAALANSLNTAQETGEGREPSIFYPNTIYSIHFIYLSTLTQSGS